LKRDLLVIIGPTASGKTALAEQVHQQRPSALISVDSQLVYREMDIGTAKPPKPGREAWSMVDLVDPGQSFSAGEFCRRSVPLIESAWARDLLPILVGGTGLYLKALLDGLAEIPPIPADMRARMEAELQEAGLAPLLARLDAADPEAASSLDRKNPRRVLRALEVYEATGQPLSEWQKRTKPSLVPERSVWLGLDPGREALEERILARVDACLTAGWLQETLELKEKWGSEAVGKSAAIGYPELLAHLDGEMDLDQARTAIVVQTRQYARRQRTWFRAQNDIHWHADAATALADLSTNHFLS